MTAWCRRALICLVFLGVLATGREAFAQKSGPLMFNFKFGPAIGVNDAATQFALQLEFGFAVVGRDGYITFPLQFHFGEGVINGHIPIAFQYDIAIRAVRGLYLYPKFMFGFSFAAYDGPGPFGDDADVGFVLGPSFGIKYVLRGRFNFMFEPFHLPIAPYFFDGGSYVSVWYGLNFGFGFNF